MDRTYPSASRSQPIRTAPVALEEPPRAQGRIAEATAAAVRVLALQPNFTIERHCAGFAVPAALAVPLTEACRAAGLP
jgi:hypothetical protein